MSKYKKTLKKIIRDYDLIIANVENSIDESKYEIVNIYSLWASGGELAGYLYGEEQTFDEMYYGFSSEEDYFTSTYGINIIQTTECGDGEMVGVSSYYVDYNYAPRDFFDALCEKSKGRTLKQ